MLKSHSNAINNKNNIINNKNSNNSDYQTAIPKLCASINKTNKPDKLKFGNRKKLKFISLVLTLCFIFSYFQPMASTVFAAPRSINVYVDDFRQGNLNIRWDSVVGGSSVKITYHSPVSSNPDKKETMILNQTTNRTVIPNLLNDIVYDFDIIVYNGLDATGAEIARGFLYFLPRMTFEAKVIKQNYMDLPGGGREIGIDPGITLEWSIPKVWDENLGEFRFINEDEILTQMENKLNEVYSNGRKIDKINYRINISTDATKLNSSPEQAGIIIEPGSDDSEFFSYVSGSQDVKSKVKISTTTEKMSLDVLGRKDKNTELPQASDYVLPHKDILPGTVYYMNIKPMFYDDGDQPVNILTSGAPKDMNGSPLIGNVSYIFTPIRFQLTRDNYNNVFVKIYRINQGSLDLPRLYYEIQASDDPTVQGDWAVKRKIDDTYFVGGYANTVISGINPNNEIYYKIVVKSDNVEDRLYSSPMPYILYMDISRPPVPLNVSISERLPAWKNVVHPITQEEIQVKSTDVTFTWEMPEDFDWNKEKGNLYFHIMLSTNQTDLNTSTDLKIDGKYWGTYPVKYRLVRYVSANSPNIEVNGNRVSYTLKGFELFKGEGDDGQLSKTIENPDNYPDFFMPNKIYYVQMYTTRAADAGSTDPDRMSDISIVKSFTTLPETDREVPAPLNVTVDINEIYKDSENKDRNRIELLFNKVDIDWRYYTSDINKNKAVYYDLYMSTKTTNDSFVKIGSTEYTDRDVKFVGVDDPTSAAIRVSVSQFCKDVNKYDPDNNPDTDNDIDPYEIFGTGLKPNTIYYFILKTRLVIDGEKPDKESIATPIVSVTTLKGDIDDPDEEARKPLAPQDFSISTDKDGNFEITGSSIIFNWTRLEELPVYEVICTSERVAPEAIPSEYEDDPVYRSFIAHYGNKDSDGKSDTFILDPRTDINSGNFKDKFMYDNVTRKFNLKIDEWLYPNRLYYFSIRAVIRDASGNKVSAWVSIPVTTSLIEMPLHIEPVIDYEIGFYWPESDPALRAEDYTIYIQGPEDADFKEVRRADLTITRDGNGFYTRIRKLKSDTKYSVRVFKGNNRTHPVYENNSLKTRDGCHEFEVKWVGKEKYDYEIAVLRENDSEYIILDDVDLQTFTDKYNRELPYYMEKTPQTAGTDNSQYLARIISIPQVLSDGTVEHVRVESNTKYYIKVRAVRVDPLDSAIISYSKYIGPVFLRTEFSQEDYDEHEDDKKKED
ncbi:MAG: ferrous iron transporter A, partial [Clostridiaceae bacterium]|nr:ferrous iron transporter A [Clostridiaceae bacterium]